MYHVVDNDATSSEEEIHRLLRLTDSRAKPIKITVSINKKLIRIELDTGVSSSIISQQTFTQIGHMRELKPLTVRLTSYQVTKLSTWYDGCRSELRRSRENFTIIDW